MSRRQRPDSLRTRMWWNPDPSLLLLMTRQAWYPIPSFGNSSMAPHERFHLKTLPDLTRELQRLGVSLPLSEDLSILAAPLPLRNGAILPNRFAVQPMEGFDSTPDGSPGPLTFRRYGRYAAGGSGLIWFEATAVLQAARSNPRQLWIHDGNVAAFRRLTEETRRIARERFGRAPLLILQLTHSGRYSKPDGVPAPIIAHHSPLLDPQHRLPPDYPLISDEELDRLQDTFVEAARLAMEAGFDGVDVKSCHRYLVSELLASHTRDGRYGGSFDNRTRFLRETLARIHDAFPSLLITTRMNAYDAIPYPFGFGVSRDDFRVPDLTEPQALAQAIAALGAPLLNISIGNPYYNPQVGRPFDFPIKGMPIPDEHPLEAIARFTSITRTIQKAIPQTPVIASGHSWLRHLMPFVASGLIQEKGAALVGQGRGAFAYPDSVVDILEKGGMDPHRCCITCSACTQIMRDGGQTGCVVRDSAIYGPEYRKARQRALDTLKEEAKRCRECEFPTCQAGCPAAVEIPAFIKAFREDRFQDAYEILRHQNPLPEICACVCPSDVQCEGRCVESIFSQHPIPIRQIQEAVCRIARREGWTGVRVPSSPPIGRVAIVGAGPAGLACAIRLVERGAAVEIFDRHQAAGGIPDRVIPSERLSAGHPEWQAILAPAQACGRVVFHGGFELGHSLSLRALREQFDAVFLALGLPAAAPLNPGHEGVIDALTFLTRLKEGSWPLPLPERVAVLGGGNTAMDAACEARRHGARDVFLIYRRSFQELPAWPLERDHALALGVHFLILTQPVGYVTDARNRLSGIRIQHTDLGPPDASGRRSPIPRPETEHLLPAGLAIEAIGQILPAPLRHALTDLTFSPDGTLAVDFRTGATSLPRVYAGGDLVNGGATAVRAVADGVRAAEAIAAVIQVQGAARC